MKVSLIYRYNSEELAMNTTEKYFKQGILISDENAHNLWLGMHEEYTDNIGLQVQDEIELSPEKPEKALEFKQDFLEVWMKIEKSIQSFEIEVTKLNEVQSVKNNSKTNLNFEL